MLTGLLAWLGVAVVFAAGFSLMRRGQKRRQHAAAARNADPTTPRIPIIEIEEN